MIYLIIVWALLGWTGALMPPYAPEPTRPSPGDTRWLTDRLFNALGAVIGGMFWNWVWPVSQQTSPGLGAGASCIGAVIGAALAADLVWIIWRQNSPKTEKAA
jgi:hypothetical protein